MTKPYSKNSNDRIKGGFMKHALLYIVSTISASLTACAPNALTLIIAVCDGNTESVHQMIQAGCDVNVYNHNLGTPLLCAAREGYSAITALLLQHKAKTNGTDKHFQETALHKAAGRGYADIVQQLLTAQASVSAQDWLGNTPLHFAARGKLPGHFDAVKFIMRACTLEQLLLSNKAHATALDIAQTAGNNDIVYLLEERIAELTPETPLLDKQPGCCTLL